MAEIICLSMKELSFRDPNGQLFVQIDGVLLKHPFGSHLCQFLYGLFGGNNLSLG